MKIEYLNPFLTATQNVLATMAQTKATALKPRLKDDLGTFGEVSGIIGMASENVVGSMVVSFSSACILDIVAKMLMEDPKPEVDQEVVDAVGEITNIICGGAKANLAKMGLVFDLATPTMIKGRGVEIRYPMSAPIVVIPFKTDKGEFVLEASLAER